MADGLRVELSEPNPSAGPGEAATVRYTVYNRSLIVDEYRISVAGVPPDWVDAPAATERIFPESAATAAITFRPPRAATVSAGTHPFTVVAASADNPALTALATGVLIVGSFVEFALDLVSPRQVADDHAASYVVRVANAGNARLVLALGASDEAGVLDCSFDEPRVDLAPGEQREVRVVARLRLPRR
jgi:hypothetical protein